MVDRISKEANGRAWGRRSGFTLLELIVVLIVMGVAVGLVAPALVSPRDADIPQLIQLIRSARETAARRGETMFLGLSSSGEWRIDGANSAIDGPVGTGRIAEYTGSAGTLIVSPLGSCSFDVRSSQSFALDVNPLTCEAIQR